MKQSWVIIKETGTVGEPENWLWRAVMSQIVLAGCQTTALGPGWTGSSPEPRGSILST